MAVAQRESRNYYETLGVLSTASLAEIRRAYRILARRYHPDVNPGKSSEERFKAIAEAYKVLSDEAKRREFDQMLEGELNTHFAKGRRAYEEAIRRAAAQERTARQRAWSEPSSTHHERATPPGSTKQARSNTRPISRPQRNQPRVKQQSLLRSIAKIGDTSARWLKHYLFASAPGLRPAARRDSAKERADMTQASPTSTRSVSVIELSLSLHDAVNGGKKSIEIPEPDGKRKVSIRIPPGVRNGAVLRTRARNSDEELVVIVRVAPHPFLRIEPKGLVCEIPITVQEALLGAQVTVPTLDEPVVVKVPSGCQSGTELRLKERGIAHPDGKKGDLFFRLVVKLPESPDAVGLKEHIGEIERYYASPVRQALPTRLLD